MRKVIIVALGSLVLASPALAQSPTARPETGTVTSPPGAGPNTANSGPASTQIATPPGGGAAESVSNNSAGASNAEQTNKPAPNTNRAGGGGGG